MNKLTSNPLAFVAWFALMLAFIVFTQMAYWGGDFILLAQLILSYVAGLATIYVLWAEDDKN